MFLLDSTSFRKTQRLPNVFATSFTKTQRIQRSYQHLSEKHNGFPYIPQLAARTAPLSPKYKVVISANPSQYLTRDLFGPPLPPNTKLIYMLKGTGEKSDPSLHSNFVLGGGGQKTGPKQISS